MDPESTGELCVVLLGDLHSCEAAAENPWEPDCQDITSKDPSITSPSSVSRQSETSWLTGRPGHALHAGSRGEAGGQQAGREDRRGSGLGSGPPGGVEGPGCQACAQTPLARPHLDGFRQGAVGVGGDACAGPQRQLHVAALRRMGVSLPAPGEQSAGAETVTEAGGC